MSEQGVRPRKLSHWAGIAVVAAVLWHNPGGSAELAITTLDKVGSAISFGMNRAGMDGQSDYFVERQPPTTNNEGGESRRETGPPATIANEQPPAPPAASGDQFNTLSPLNGTATDAVVTVVRLHELVEAVLADDPGVRS